jgi:hypothetical protein
MYLKCKEIHKCYREDGMSSTLKLAILLLTATITLAQPAEVAEIDIWIDEIEGMIEAEYLVERHVMYVHQTIPSIGMPLSFVKGWFDQIPIGDSSPDIDELPLQIENYYQHSGSGGVIETYYFMPDGEMVCCISLHMSDAHPSMEHMNTIYFSDGEPIYYVGSPGETFESMDAEALQKAQQRLANAELLYQLFMNPPVPIPPFFWERL